VCTLKYYFFYIKRIAQRDKSNKEKKSLKVTDTAVTHLGSERERAYALN